MVEEFLDEKEKKILELEVRKKIYTVVKEFPGCHFREIERKIGLSTGSVSYHLDYLTKRGLIKEDKEGNNSRYFTRGFKSENKKMMGLLRQESVRKILIFLLTNNQGNHEQIVDFVKLSSSTVSWHLKKLENEHIIRFIKHGRKTCYDLLIDREEIISLLITHRESFLDTLVDNVVEMWSIN